MSARCTTFCTPARFAAAGLVFAWLLAPVFGFSPLLALSDDTQSDGSQSDGSQSSGSQSSGSQSSGGEAEKSRDGSDDGEGYVELFDPDSEDPQEPPERSIPEFRLPADEFINPSAEDAAREPAERRPWDAEPQRVPDRVLAPGDPRDPRSVELFYYGCSDELERRDVTLFANGTLRLRKGPHGVQEMRLEEIGPVELRTHLNRLLRIRASRDFPDQLRLEGSVAGRWIDTCRFQLDLPGFSAVRLEVGSFDLLPLELKQLQQYADELEGLTRPLVRPDALPPDYEPQIGDVLRTHEGKVYRIRGRTTDGGALELESLDGAWRIFVPEDEFPEYFAALEIDLSSDPWRR